MVKFLRISIVIALLMLVGVMFFSFTPQVMAYEVDISHATEEDDNSTFTEAIEGLITSLFSWIPDVLQMFVDILLSPFKALASIWESWADTLHGWAGPIIAAFVVIVILLMVRLYTGVDDALDTFQDWISPGDE